MDLEPYGPPLPPKSSQPQSEHASKHSDVESEHSERCSDSEYYQVRPKHKKHSNKTKHKSKPSHISQSSAEEDESSTHVKTLTKSQHKVLPKPQPQDSTDPVFYREVDMTDLPSQYTEEVETFRQILDLPDPRETLPRSSTTVLGLDDEKGQQELRPRGPSAMLPLNPILKDAFEKFEQDFLASNLPEGKYIKPPASTAKYYKVGQPYFEDKLQELSTDFAKICISPKPSGAPVAKVPLQVLKELENQARQNLSTINFTATFVRTASSCNTVLEKGLHSAKATIKPVCHSSEPQTPSIRVSYPRPKGLGHRCSKHKLDGSHCLCLPSNSSPSQGDPKNQAMPLPNHSNSPRLSRDALVLGPSAALSRDPTTTPSVNNTTQTVPQLRVPQQSATSQPPRLVSRSGQLQEQGFSVEVAERIAAPQRSSTRTIYKSKWALFEKWCRENMVDYSTPSVKQISDFFMYLYQDLNRRPSTIDGYRTAIVDTLGPTAHHIAHNADLHRLLSSFHRDRPKSSRNLPK